ncbi:14788_t:CDS:2, partial [Cetraspora pellucida]
VNLNNFLLPEEIEDTTNLILILESEIEDTTDLISALEPEIENLEVSITILLTDISQTIQPMTKSLTNLFISRTWKTQTYYCLGKLLDQHANPAMIKDFIERKQGKRKAKDTWRSAYRTYELFRICLKKVISQLQTLTATQLIKLTDGDYHRLLD